MLVLVREVRGLAQVPEEVRRAHLLLKRMRAVELDPVTVGERERKLQTMGEMSRDDLRHDVGFCRLHDRRGCCCHKFYPFVSRDGTAKV